jgi:hypothetical protein
MKRNRSASSLSACRVHTFRFSPTTEDARNQQRQMSLLARRGAGRSSGFDKRERLSADSRSSLD